MPILLFLALSAAVLAAQPATEWPAYGNDPGGSRYSELDQIDRTNAAQLEVAWTYRTGALEPRSRLNEKAAFEATPILVGGRLYLSTPFNHVIALEPETGREIWTFDPKVDRSRGYSEVTSRGVSAWRDPAAEEAARCRLRIYAGTIDARLIALDGATGELCDDFGEGGEIDLEEGIDLKDRGDYQVTSPPAIAAELVIVGSAIGDNRRAQVEKGTVRAFDARTGELRWSWDPLPSDLETGGANAWAPLAVDHERDLVFVPTGSPSPDFFGGLRPGANRHANSVVALRASTGELVWSFQVVRHDLWDYDVAAQPSLIEVAGRPAVAVNTKMGHFFLLDRETGESLLDVEERPVPESAIPDEQASPTQLFPKNPALAPSALTADDAWGPTEQDRAWCRERIAALDTGGLYIPPSKRGTIVFPGNGGGVNWGGAAIDPERGVMVVMTNRLPTTVRLIPRADYDRERQRDNGRFGGEFARQQGAPYAMYREPLLGPSGAPCNAPPWGALSAVRLETGDILWEVPLGVTAAGDAEIPGALGLGGPLVTAGGLIFISATRLDDRLHVHDLETGEALAHLPLPAGGQATPMTYRGSDGKQYVVIAAGGHGKLGTSLGDHVVAFRVP